MKKRRLSKSQCVCIALLWGALCYLVLAGAREEMKAFARNSGIPIVATMMGIGAQVSQSGAFWRVRVGPFDDRAAAQEALESLADQGHKPVITQQK